MCYFCYAPNTWTISIYLSKEKSAFHDDYLRTVPTVHRNNVMSSDLCTAPDATDVANKGEI